MRILLTIAAVTAVFATTAGASVSPPWWAHINGHGVYVCDRGSQHQFGPFTSKANCDTFADEHNNGGGDPGETDPPVTAIPPQIDRMGACQLDGQYVDVTNVQFFAGEYVDANGVTQKLVPANWELGVGETCDNPANQGFKPAGVLVDDGGAVYLLDPTFNVYPFWTK